MSLKNNICTYQPELQFHAEATSDEGHFCRPATRERLGFVFRSWRAVCSLTTDWEPASWPDGAFPSWRRETHRAREIKKVGLHWLVFIEPTGMPRSLAGSLLGVHTCCLLLHDTTPPGYSEDSMYIKPPLSLTSYVTLFNSETQFPCLSNRAKGSTQISEISF